MGFEGKNDSRQSRAQHPLRELRSKQPYTVLGNQNPPVTMATI